MPNINDLSHQSDPILVQRLVNLFSENEIQQILKEASAELFLFVTDPVRFRGVVRLTWRRRRACGMVMHWRLYRIPGAGFAIGTGCQFMSAETEVAINKAKWV
jgi:hypothetical protein